MSKWRKLKMTRSYKDVNYLLRTKKQIERKLIVEALQHLHTSVDLSRYHYLGLGSIYFADFQLFHKYLNINKMTSIEKNPSDEKRFRFNKPYGFIDFKISDAKDYLPDRLDWNDKLFIWLDYDGKIDEDIISSINLIASKAKSLDIFIITVNADSLDLMKEGVFDDFKDKFDQYLEPTLTKPELKKDYTKILGKIINACVSDGLTYNQEKRSFLQLFNYCYADGSTMYTFGGIFFDLDGEPSLEALKSRISTLNHVSCESDIKDIDCPIITSKEKMYIDSYIKEGEFKGEVDQFCLGETDLKNYCKYYKYYPQFFESIY